MASRRPPYWALAAALSICVATVFTVSAALGGLAIAIGLYARQFHNKVQRFSILKAVFPAATFFAFCLLVYTAVYPTKHGAEISLTPSPRWHTWTTSFHSFLAHPIFGNGLGVPLADVRNVTPAGVHEYLTDPHNAWLSVAGQTGVVGLVAYCALVVWLFRSIRGGNIVGETPAIIRSALFGAFVVVLYQTMSGSVEDMRHVWLLFGLIAAATEIRQEIAGTVEN
jgi:O-antigen ligase